MISKKKEKPTMEPVTHANPNTESPKATPKNHHNNNYNRTNSVFSVGTGKELLMQGKKRYFKTFNYFRCWAKYSEHTNQYEIPSGR